LIDKGINIRLL